MITLISRLNKLNSYKRKLTILDGSESLDFLKACIREVAQLLKNETLVLIEGANHGGVFMHSDIIASEVQKSLIKKVN